MILEKEFGRSNRRLRKIAHIILDRRNDYQVKLRCASYIISGQLRNALSTRAGINQTDRNILRAQAVQSVRDTSLQVIDDCMDQIKSGNFQYKRKGNRLYHPIQNIPSTLRSELMNQLGYVWEYDISSAVVTLSYRRYILEGGKRSTVVESYLQDPKLYRKNLAKTLGLPEPKIKLAINTAIHVRALSPKSGFNRNSQLLDTLCGMPTFLKFKEIFAPLHKEINRIFNLLREDNKAILLARKLNPKSELAKTRLKTISAPIKHQIYTQLELEFQSEIRASCPPEVRLMFVHDGWYSTHPVNVPVAHTVSGPVVEVNLGMIFGRANANANANVNVNANAAPTTGLKTSLFKTTNSILNVLMDLVKERDKVHKLHLTPILTPPWLRTNRSDLPTVKPNNSS